LIYLACFPKIDYMLLLPKIELLAPTVDFSAMLPKVPFQKFGLAFTQLLADCVRSARLIAMPQGSFWEGPRCG
jgi:hypothetical protein